MESLLLFLFIPAAHLLSWNDRGISNWSISQFSDYVMSVGDERSIISAKDVVT